jgi:hypothetical protein
LKRLRQYFPVKSLLTFLLIVTLPQSVSSAPSSLSPVTSSELSNNKQSVTEKYLLMEEEMQATQASACNSLEPPFLKTEDKIVLAPIVFQGKDQNNTIHHILLELSTVYYFPPLSFTHAQTHSFSTVFSRGLKHAARGPQDAFVRPTNIPKK